MSGIAVSAEGLTKVFGSVPAVTDVSFSVAAGSVFGLLGPNGAGKTTLIRILTTIIRPTAGRAAILGHDVSTEARTVRRLIGLAGQYAAVDPYLTGRENLRLIGRLSQLPGPRARARADELLGLFGLERAANRSVRTYSGGMRRRLDVAAALVARPPVLFFDEPTTGLDPASRNSLWQMIRELATDGTTVLLTTQYLEEADRLADRVVVVSQGRLLADDTPAALKDRLGATIIELEFGDDARAERAAGLLSSGQPAAAARSGTAVRLTSRAGPRVLIDVLRDLDAAHLTPQTLAVREPSLDDVFLALTGQGAESPGPADAVPGPAAPNLAGTR